MRQQASSRVGILVAAFLSQMLIGTELWACTCAHWFEDKKIRSMVEQEVKRTNLIFEGEVESVEIRASGRPAPAVESTASFTFFGRVRLVRIRALRVYKGPSEAVFELVTGGGGGDCGFDFEVGKKYLVYADGKPKDLLFTSICTRTQLLEDAGPDLRYLNGDPPTEDDLLTPTELLRRDTGEFCGRLVHPEGRRFGDHTAIYVWKEGEPFIDEARFERPDKKGNFCAEFIDPGRYLLSAVERTLRGPVRYIGLYGASDPIRGEPIIVESQPGKKVTGLDIHMQPQPVYNVSGRIVTADGSNIKFKSVEIKATQAPDSPIAYLDFIEPHDDGSFIIPRVPLGRIVLRTYMSRFVDDSWEETESEVVVADGDVDGVLIVLKRKLTQ